MSKPIERFADTVCRFCRWAESEPQDSTSEARTARRLLAELYLQVIDLPEVSADADAPEIGQEQYQLVFKRFGALPFNYYSECFNPLVVRRLSATAHDFLEQWYAVAESLHYI